MFLIVLDTCTHTDKHTYTQTHTRAHTDMSGQRLLVNYSLTKLMKRQGTSNTPFLTVIDETFKGMLRSIFCIDINTHSDRK